MSHNLLHQVQAEGVSVWLDGVTRGQLRSGAFAGLVRDLAVSGVTTNPTLLAMSLADAGAYASDLADLKARRVQPGEAARLLAAEDVRSACDILLPAFEHTDGADGWVSFEVDPGFADDLDATMAEVRALSWLVDRPNVMIKIPATSAGVAAIAAATAEGHNINATLIFSPERYRDVLGAYATGLERARSGGLDISSIHSVASVFVSRVDAALAALSTEPHAPAAHGAQGAHGADSATRAHSHSAFASPGVANARQAYRFYQHAMATTAWQGLLAAGANPQRPLWASTGVKDPAADPTTYVVGLAIPGTVNTMPLATLMAAAQAPPHALRDGSSLRDTLDMARGLERLSTAGDELMARLLHDGVTKFRASWESVLEMLGQRLGPAALPRQSDAYDEATDRPPMSMFTGVNP